MSKVLAVLAVAATAQPSGQTFGGSYLCKFNDAAQIVADVKVTSDDLPDGTHTFSAQALDTNNGVMGDAVTSGFTLAGGQIVIPGAPTPPAPTPAPAPAGDTYLAPVSVSFSIVSA